MPELELGMRAEYEIDDFHVNVSAYEALSERLMPLLEARLRSERDMAER